MDLSNIARARIMEHKMAADPTYRKRVTASGRPTLSKIRQLADEELVETLSKLGLEFRREDFGRLASSFASAEELAEQMFRTHLPDLRDWGQDRLWMGLAVLWERWLPQRPSFEMIEEWMYAGRVLAGKGRDPVGACEKWLGVWSAVQQIMDSQRMGSIEEFDEKYRGTDCVIDCLQDLEAELWNAGLDDNRYWERGIEFATQYLARFVDADRLITENMRRALATFHAALGRRERTDALFRQWLQLDPSWGWGWIGWSDCYSFAREDRDPAKAERILLDGLGVTDVQDRVELLDRLVSLYMDQGREREAAEVHSQTHALQRRSDREAFRRTTPAQSTKVGRNVPCPCGSGKKYKKCCGSV